AQEPDPAPDDTAPDADTIPPDTVPADTLEGDTVPSDTAGRGPDPEAVQEDLAGEGFPERDSVFRGLLEESGHRVVEYRGRSVSLDVPDRRIRLRDSAQANYSDAALQADSITYRSRLQFMSAAGDVRLASPDQRRMTTDSVLYYDVSRLKGTVLDARTSFAARGAEWQVQGDAVPIGDRTLYVNRGSFTSCDRERPHYFFRAGQIKMVSQDVIAAWPVTLYVADVPVFWLPFFAQDIRPDRRSGIVPPQFGINDIVRTSDETRRQISGAGYYWAIDRFMDAAFTVDWFSGQFTRLNGQFRYNVRKKFLEGDVRISRDFADRSNFQLDASHRQRLTPDTRLQADVRFVTEEEIFRGRSFETSEQTQTIDSDVGVDHDFGFGNVSLSGRRRQFVGSEGRVDFTLPEANLSLSPVTLFEAPRNRAGFFDNMTLSPGGLSFSRRQRNRDGGDDVSTLRASVGPSIRLGDLSVSSSGSFQRQETTPLRIVEDDDGVADSVELDPRLQSTVDWSASTDYQVDLVGSTSLRPTVEVAGGWFRSRTPPDTVEGDTVPDTEGAFVETPTRVNVGASLTSDLYGFFPGFGPFSSIRHKISPRFRWRFSPAVELEDPSLGDVPGFPGGRGETRHTLSVNLNQTFEAKMPVDDGPEEESGREDADGGEDEGGGAEPEGDGDEEPADDAAGEADDDGGEDDGDGDDDEDAGADAETGGGAAPGRQEGQREERTVTLLSIRSDALQFDFDRPGPALVTDRFSNSIGSDLFRDLNLTVEFDLFEGSGEERIFDPFLSRLNASVSFRSGQDLGDLIGLGADDGAAGPPGPTSTGEVGDGRSGAELEQGQHEAGPWRLSLDYTLRRTREDGTGGSSPFTTGEGSQTLGGSLSLQPTRNWAMSWSTSYNVDESEFSAHEVSLTRNLHRWQAQFDFRRAPNGNFLFRFFVRLTDAPDLMLDYDQQSEPLR
ncbi:MAG: LPS-assembly protein LptD, partial [Gemmatimonadota bacterium]